MRSNEKCKAKTRSGERCGSWPVTGATVCRMHGGSAPQVAANANARAQQQAVSNLLQNLGAPTEIDPGQALLDLIAAKNGEVLWLRAMVQSIEQDKLTWGTADHESGIGQQGPIDKITKKAAVNIWWEMLRKAEDQLAKYASEALRAGIEERRVRIAENQGNLIVGVIRRILDRLQLNNEQRGLISTVVPEEIRAIGRGEL
ncbi:HGGxSTG domain-containing protein [Glutamicibacter nicotianae]|uniref:HGGxSTG domain-containing protein n=1 Tax=Glutamicibacter nicotianae TaxID=37929 RepID=UPI0013CEAE76|nr:HGGxSTG domain-containing protein [Glutamicibacter nicotianae]